MPDSIIEVRGDDDMLKHDSMRRVMELEVAHVLEHEWNRLGVGSDIPIMKLSFMYSETDKWDEKAPIVPLSSLAGAQDRFE